MQFLTTATTFFSLLLLSASACPTGTHSTAAKAVATNTPSATSTSNIDSALVPIFSIKTGSGIGANGVAIPKQCPPSRADFIAKLSANVAAGNVLGTSITWNNNPAVQDTQTNEQRATAMLVTLQNFTGVRGVGCPAVSTPELLKQQKTGVTSPS